MRKAINMGRRMAAAPVAGMLAYTVPIVAGLRYEDAYADEAPLYRILLGIGCVRTAGFVLWITKEKL